MDEPPPFVTLDDVPTRRDAYHKFIGMSTLVQLLGRMSRRWRCGACKNTLASGDVTVCPICRDTLA